MSDLTPPTAANSSHVLEARTIRVPHSPPLARAARTRGTGIPKLIYLARILSLCFFPITTVVVGNAVLLYVPQAKEALFAFNPDEPHFLSLQVSFEIAYILWMLAAWYVARLLLGKRFEPDLIGPCRSPTFAASVAKLLPRALALLAGLPLTFFLLRRPELRTLGIVSIFACALVLVGLVFRRKWAERRNHAWRKKWLKSAEEDSEHFDDLSQASWNFILFLFAISLVLWIALPIGMSSVARVIGAPALLLFALMSWTVFGGFILTYLPKSYHFPAMTWVAALALFGFYRCNENHPVAPAVDAIRNGPRDSLEKTFTHWLQVRSNPDAPVIFVAIAGGASRAAYWSTSALGLLEDEAQKKSLQFSDNIFVISGVSGGSLGAAAFVTTVDLLRQPQHLKECNSVRDVANGFTSRDDLSTVVGLMLFPDLFQRFLPFRNTSWDRSRGLEEVWTRDWQELLTECVQSGASVPNPWGAAFTDLYLKRAGKQTLPALALNSTAMYSGQAVLQSQFTMERSDAFDLLDTRLQTTSLTLSQAVHNSARFPYISPAGVVTSWPTDPKTRDKNEPGPIWDRLGDGGYVEASGALTILQILQELREHGLIREDSSTPSNTTDAAQPGRDFIRPDQIRILLLDNTPILGPALLCGLQHPAAPSGTRSEQPQNLPLTAPLMWTPGADFLAPPLGAFTTRGGRALSAQVDVRGWAGGCTSHFAELRFPAPPKEDGEPSMDWILSTQSRKQIDAALTGGGGEARKLDPLPVAALRENLNIVRSWFAPPQSSVAPSAAPSSTGISP